MSTALDRRAEAAAAAVRAAVAQLEPPPGEVPALPRRRWPALVAAVVLVAAAIGGAALVERDDGDDVVAGPDGALPRYVVGDVPQGLRVTGAADLPAPGPTGSTGSTFRFYGRGDADDPFRSGDLTIFIVRGLGPPSPSPGSTGVRVRGVDGWIGEEPETGLGLSWEEPGVGSVALASRSLGRAELLAVAEDLRRRGDELVLDQPPGGYRLVADLLGLPGMVLDVFGTGERGSVVGYQSSDDGDRILAVTAVVDRPGALDAIRWLGGTGTRKTTVRGHDAWQMPGGRSEAFFYGPTLAWRDAPGVLVTVTGIGLTEDELRAAAESLRPATDEEWRELRARADDEDEASDFETHEDMPTLAEGPGWRYARDEDDGVCFEVPDPPMTSSSCSSPGMLDQPQLYEGAVEVDEGWWLHGRVPAEVRQVALQRGADERLVVDTLPMSAGGLRAWAGLLPGVYPGTVTVVALAADGSEVDRTTVDVQQETTVEPPSSTPTTS